MGESVIVVAESVAVLSSPNGVDTLYCRPGLLLIKFHVGFTEVVATVGGERELTSNHYTAGKEETGQTEETNGQIILLNGQGKALPQPRLLPTTVRGGVSWCNVRPCGAPTTLAGYGSSEQRTEHCHHQNDVSALR